MSSRFLFCFFFQSQTQQVQVERRGFIWGECKWEADFHVGWNVGRYPWRLKGKNDILWCLKRYLLNCGCEFVFCAYEHLWFFSSCRNAVDLHVQYKYILYIYCCGFVKLLQGDLQFFCWWMQWKFARKKEKSLNTTVALSVYLTHHPSAFSCLPPVLLSSCLQNNEFTVSSSALLYLL